MANLQTGAEAQPREVSMDELEQIVGGKDYVLPMGWHMTLCEGSLPILWQQACVGNVCFA